MTAHTPAGSGALSPSSHSNGNPLSQRWRSIAVLQTTRVKSTQPRRISSGCPSIVSVAQFRISHTVLPQEKGESNAELTPWFHRSQKAVTPMSKPTPNANAPAKMVETYTPEEPLVSSSLGVRVRRGRGGSLLRLTRTLYADVANCLGLGFQRVIDFRLGAVGRTLMVACVKER